MPVSAASQPWRHRSLILTLTRREFGARYRGTLLGVFWTLLSPLFLLAMFTLVFGVVLASRWPGSEEQGIGMFALRLLAGLLVHSMFAEAFGRAPVLVTSNPNYVNKVVFPLETLGWVDMLTALLHAFAGLVLLVLVNGLWGTGFAPTQLAVPLILLPYGLLVLAIVLLAAALGVYVRDLAQMTAPVVMGVMFLGPVFVPRSAMPAMLQPWLVFNPVTVPIEQLRAAIFDATWPDWPVLGVYWVVAMAAYALAAHAFAVLKRGFADVL